MDKTNTILNEYIEYFNNMDIEYSYEVDDNFGGRKNIIMTLCCEKDDLKYCLTRIEELSDMLENSNFDIKLEIMEEKLAPYEVESRHNMHLENSIYKNPDPSLFFVNMGEIIGGYALYRTQNKDIYHKALQILKESAVKMQAYLMILEENGDIKACDIDFINGKAIIPTANQIDLQDYYITGEEIDRFEEYAEYFRERYANS